MRVWDLSNEASSEINTQKMVQTKLAVESFIIRWWETLICLPLSCSDVLDKAGALQGHLRAEDLPSNLTRNSLVIKATSEMHFREKPLTNV